MKKKKKKNRNLLTLTLINFLGWHAVNFLYLQLHLTWNHCRSLDWNSFVVDLLDYDAIDSVANLVRPTLCVASQFVSFVDIGCLKWKEQCCFEGTKLLCGDCSYLQSMKINAANAAIKRIVTTAKNIIKYSIGTSATFCTATEKTERHFD